MINFINSLIYPEPKPKPMKGILQIAAMLLLFTHWAYAQDRTISGTVTDRSGAPIAGVNISIKGTSLGTLSDAAGKYSLVVPSTANTIVFSFVGYASQEIAITESAEINVQLEETVSQLSERSRTLHSPLTFFQQKILAVPVNLRLTKPYNTAYRHLIQFKHP